MDNKILLKILLTISGISMIGLGVFVFGQQAILLQSISLSRGAVYLVYQLIVGGILLGATSDQVKETQ